MDNNGFNNDFNNGQFNNGQFNNGMITPEEPKKKKKTGLILILAILLVGIGVGLGYYVPKLMDKKDNANSTNNTTNTNENETKEGTGSEEIKTGNDQVNDQATKDYKKPSSNPKYKLLKEEERTVKLNNKDYHLLAYYYDYTNSDLQESNAYGVLKEVYLEGNLVVDKSYLLYDDKDEVNEEINEDIKYTNDFMTVINDQKSGEQYLVYFYTADYLSYVWATEDDNVGFPEEGHDVSIISTGGKVLFNMQVIRGGSISFFWIKDKSQIGDRYSVQGDSSDDYSYIFDGVNAKDYHSLYMENIHEESYPVEFKQDHFYSFEDNDDEEVIVDYIYTIENGTLNKQVLKRYPYENIIIGGAGQD